MKISSALAAFVVAAFCTNAHAVYRCTENGKTMFSDKPCASAPVSPSDQAAVGSPGEADVRPPAKAVPTNSLDYSTPYGDWRGQTQFQATENGQRIAGAHSVVPLVLSIDAAGKVKGGSPENGCRVLGVASPGLTPSMLNLDVSFSGCQFGGFNRRFFGFLSLQARDKAAGLNLNSHIVGVGASALYDVKATLRR